MGGFWSWLLKIVSKVNARRIERVFPHIVCLDQLGFVKTRYIGQNINNIFGTNKTTGYPRCPSSCNWTFKKPLTLLDGNLSKMLLLFLTKSSPSNSGFQLSNIKSWVLNIGFSTNYFSLLRWVRQGYPLSPFLFVWAVVLLACKIWHDKEIKVMDTFQKALK